MNKQDLSNKSAQSAEYKAAHQDSAEFKTWWAMLWESK